MRRKYPEPRTNAYHDGTRYYCTDIYCYADRVTMKEIDRMPMSHELAYVPILQCAECGATYFGLITRDLEAVEVIKQHAEKVKRAEEERKQNAQILADMDKEAFYKEEKRREQEQRKEVLQHEAEENGDIILPNILTV